MLYIVTYKDGTKELFRIRESAIIAYSSNLGATMVTKSATTYYNEVYNKHTA